MDSSPTEMANSPTDQLLGPKRNIRYTKEIVHIIIGQFALLSSEKSRHGLRTDARHYLFPLDVVNCSKNTMPGRELQQLLALSDFFCFDYARYALKVRQEFRRAPDRLVEESLDLARLIEPDLQEQRAARFQQLRRVSNNTSDYVQPVRAA